MNVQNKANARKFVAFFRGLGYPDNFISGLAGNICTESAHTFEPRITQRSFKLDDDVYTACADNNVQTYNGKMFVNDSVGYGLCQWTSSGRKTGLLEYAKSKGKSVGDLQIQLEWIDKEIHSTGYANCRKAISENWSIEDCARIICTEFERPAKKDDATVQQNRINFAIEFYNEFIKEEREEKTMSNKILAISCGHYMGTSGKRCMKAIDPNETREWWLNNRVGVYVEQYLNEYEEIKIVRLDDTTGNTDVTLQSRRNKANALPANFYLAIHHNAGINGGNGGGVVVYARNDKALASDFYNRVILANGLKGNRSNPIQIGTSLYEVREPNAYSILLENGFMDSKTDTPKILTDEYARNTAKGICDFFVNYWQLKKKGDKPVEEETKPVYSGTVYVVKSGDNLTKIAKMFNTTVDEIMSLNPNITNPNKISVGQKIIVGVTEYNFWDTIKEGDPIRLKAGATYYNGKTIPSWVFNSKLYYRGTNSNGVVFSTLQTGAVTGTTKKEYILPY